MKVKEKIKKEKKEKKQRRFFIKKYAALLGKNLVDLAEETGISVSTLSKLNNGQIKYLNIEYIFILSSSLGINLTDLFIDPQIKMGKKIKDEKKKRINREEKKSALEIVQAKGGLIEKELNLAYRYLVLLILLIIAVLLFMLLNRF